ncbi:host cell division inhibitor Icd-like protein [Avibacterium endocarditidis]|uniref:host cell division inhibitor Icd-like protein n=1 Tax=Avibacterium endocarditidis TaxID=380674 RepID=UPI0039F0017C
MKLFIFAAIRRTDLTNKIYKIRIFAETEMQARAKLAKQFVLIFAGCINVKNLAKNDRTLSPIVLTSAMAEVQNG